LNTKQFLTQVFTHTCESSIGRGHQIPKLKRQNSMPYYCCAVIPFAVAIAYKYPCC